MSESTTNTTPPVYGGTWGQIEGRDLRLPSGGLVQLREPDFEELLRAGVVNVFDKLSPEVNSLLQKAQGSKSMNPEDALKLVKDEGSMDQLLETINAVTLMAVMQPEIAPIPETGTPRVAGVIYVDKIPLTDRVAILEEVMSLSEKADEGLAAFRPES